ncbi:antibiotic biosynthesis monooxygenase family protein [Streptomyces sp. NPDC001777]|uniref:antibiotic biosynthesis monooxygenase family protein n=1 Tax=Streptomyces sp. NPDC001777 TaxID=3364608 RepID=UPI0036B27E33
MAGLGTLGQPIATGSTEDGRAVEPGLEHAGVRTVQGGDRAHRLANTFLVPKERTEAFLTLFRRQAEFMTAQPGFVSLQMHKGTAGSRLLMNVAVREPIEALVTTFGSPEFQRMAATFPGDVVSYPHRFSG